MRISCASDPLFPINANDSQKAVFMVHHEFNLKTGILFVTPEGPLEKSAFASIVQSVDGYIAREGQLKALMITKKSFPGWKDFAAFTSHFRFVSGHEKHIARIAVLSDKMASRVLPEIAKHFVHPVLKHFALVGMKRR